MEPKQEETLNFTDQLIHLLKELYDNLSETDRSLLKSLDGFIGEDIGEGTPEEYDETGVKSNYILHLISKLQGKAYSLQVSANKINTIL